jgi:ribosome-associated protein
MNPAWQAPCVTRAIANGGIGPDTAPMEIDEPFDRPSKSARKRESQELQELGEALVSLPDALLAQLPLPENLRDAVIAARSITSHGALLRQHQYIGKLMRKVDAAPIREAIAQHEEKHRAEARRFQRLEQWRDRLLREGEPALKELTERHPDLDTSGLAGLVAEARRESEGNRPPRAARALFQRLRELLT